LHANVYIPEEFLTHIEGIMPSHLDMASFVASCQKPLRKSIRVNTLKVSVEDFLVRAKDKGWELEPVPWCETGFWYGVSLQFFADSGHRIWEWLFLFDSNHTSPIDQN
jgi:16S rRNA (cytosine1407-C5)-methyltransferase